MTSEADKKQAAVTNPTIIFIENPHKIFPGDEDDRANYIKVLDRSLGLDVFAVLEIQDRDRTFN